MLPQTQPFGLSNDVMFASKRSPFFKKAMEALPSTNRWHGAPYLTVMYSTGPMHLSLVYNSLLAEQQKDILVIPHELYSDRKTRYFKHLRGSTWHSSGRLTDSVYDEALVVIIIFDLGFTCCTQQDSQKKNTEA